MTSHKLLLSKWNNPCEIWNTLWVAYHLEPFNLFDLLVVHPSYHLHTLSCMCGFSFRIIWSPVNLEKSASSGILRQFFHCFSAIHATGLPPSSFSSGPLILPFCQSGFSLCTRVPNGWPLNINPRENSFHCLVWLWSFDFNNICKWVCNCKWTNSSGCWRICKTLCVQWLYRHNHLSTMILLYEAQRW